ncbi:hypothetical protein ACF09H_38625 [Streptomyces sp. NPDC014983]|uniref:hypothetical protein n=1 Tax=Streptomyces sp. NPDC014983 TaxID=3364933 RepID=UPI0036F9EC97
MSDTTTEATTSFSESAAVTAADGTSVPIEFTITQAAAEQEKTSRARSGPGLRALPAAVFGAEALSTGAAALYSATGLVGTMTAAGVVVGTTALAGAGAAVRKARRTRRAGSTPGSFRNGGRGGRGSHGALGVGGARPHRSGSGGGSFAGGSRGSRGGAGHGTSGIGRQRGHGGLGSGSGSAGGLSLTKGRAQRAASTGTGPAAPGASSLQRGHAGGSGGKRGLLDRIARRKDGASGGADTFARRAGGAGSHGSTGRTPAGGGRGGARSTVAAATGRAARAAARGLSAVGRKASGLLSSPSGQALRERIRSARRELAKRGKAAVPFLLRAAGASLAAGALGALVYVPGLLLRGVAAAFGGLLRWLRLAPRNGKKWGARFTRWAVTVSKWVFVKLMRKAKAKYADAIRPDVLTDFPEPGRRTKSDWPSDHFGGNLVSVFQRETEGMRAAYAHYEPPMMLAVAAEYWGLPEGLTSTGEAIRQLAINTSDKYPADARMADLVAQVYALLHQAAQKAAEVGPLFAKVHEHDLRRYEEPRPGEHMWNILERRQDGSFNQHQPSHFVAVTQDIAHVYARYEPGHMSQVAAEFEGIPAGIENVAAAVEQLQVRSNDKYPVDKAIVDALTDVHTLLLQAASAAQDLMPNFRRLHAPDIARHEAPRNGVEAEGMWDV